MNKPIEISLPEWQEIIAVPEVRDMWGLDNQSAEEFADVCYGVKFNFHSGGPGYVGDLFVLMGDALSAAPAVLSRNHTTGKLEVVEFSPD
jgi:hypothetical protein